MPVGQLPLLIAFTTLSLGVWAFSLVEDDPSLFHGRWHQVEVTLRLDDSIGFTPEVAKSIKKSIATQERVKAQIQSGALAIITQFNHDGTFSHEIVYSDPAVKFPAWRETGTWSWDAPSNTLSRRADNVEMTTLALASVKKITPTELVLEVKFTEGESKGIVETVYLSRFLEAQINKH